MNLTVAPLSKGDKIVIVAPAKSIDEDALLFAKSFFEKNGYEVKLSTNCKGVCNYFSGTETERLNDLQEAIDDVEVKAIVCARGGYGCVQLVDKIQWASMLRSPKWIVGFSDVTVFHQRIQKLGMQSIHATMPLNFRENSEESLSSLLAALEGKAYSVSYKANSLNKLGVSEGTIVGGNLSVLCSLLGTDDQIEFKHTILFIEDLAEYKYAIDRMFHSLRKAGVLNNIRGLIVGGMTDIKDTPVPFGDSLENIILTHLEFHNIPVAFDFPAGHIPDNRALILGSHVHLAVGKDNVLLEFKAQ